ncbi:MAG: molybdenum cofactor guanylyltransferase [Planctomycetota bacterium]|jgi:molybdopterin-guanine dinucleotide biosynthesis protein A
MTRNSIKCTITGAILAGGKARRIGGIVKGTLKINGDVSIVQHLIDELNCTDISDIVIIANDQSPYLDYAVEIIPDLRTGIGPMGGIESGLMHFANRCDAVMFLPCDLPNITAKEMLILQKAFIESKAPAVFAETNNSFWHPLCSVVHKNLAKNVSGAIDRGERKIRNVWKQVKAAKVNFDDASAFFNINSLADINQWRQVNYETKR